MSPTMRLPQAALAAVVAKAVVEKVMAVVIAAVEARVVVIVTATVDNINTQHGYRPTITLIYFNFIDIQYLNSLSLKRMFSKSQSYLISYLFFRTYLLHFI